MKRTGITLGIAAAALLFAPRLAQAQVFPATPSWASAEDQRVGGVAFGDANGDGLLDLAAGTYSGGFPELTKNALVFLQAAGGLETTPSWVSDDIRHSTSVGWGFVTGGEQPDLIVVNGGAGSQATVIYPSSAGGLDTTASWVSQNPGSTSGIDFALGDANGDGVPDLFVSNQCYTPCTETVSLGYLSAGGALPETPNWTSDNLGMFGGIALADVDGSDVQTETYSMTAPGGVGLFWIPNAPLARLHRVLVDRDDPGKVTYDAGSGYVLFATPPAAGATVEFLHSHSSQPDLAIGARPGGVKLYPGSANGPATTPETTLGTSLDNYKDLVFADLDLDGDLDLVAGGSQDTPLTVYENDQGTLSTTASWTSTETDYSAEDIVVADFNGDGYPDVGAVEFSSATVVRIHLNQDGVLEKDPSFTLPWEGMSTASIGAGDVDGDGMPDLAIGRAGAPLQVYTNQLAPMAAPSIDTVQPSQQDPGASVTLEITGTDIGAKARVYLEDTELENVSLQGNVLSATTPANLPSGAYDVFVVNPDLQVAKLAGGFVVTGDADAGVDAAVEGGVDAAADTGADATMPDAGPDTGTGGGAQDAGVGGGSGAAGAAGSLPAASGDGADDDGGCGCRVGAPASRLGGFGFLVGLMMLGMQRKGVRP